jgi:maltose alpha-D-glucosyltransferase / alpha-amylase
LNVVPTMPPEVKLAESQADELWYKDAIIYQLHVKAFADSNDDGIGDFNGLTDRLDYLQDLGVTTLWLLPFYPSPGRDDGYDIADYGTINPDFGTMKDFRRFMGEAKRRGLRVITELVVNHTSDQHAWFKRARRSPRGSSARNWYVWSDTDQKFLETRIIFTDTEKSNWAWDAEAGAYYWHRFFSHQPDLNFDNPRVIRAVVQVMKRWLDTGVDGFRLDAIPYLVERAGTNNENLPETHIVIKKIRKALEEYATGKVLLAEANQWPEDVSAYFGDGDECHMAYHFPLMPRIYMAIAQEDRFPIADIIRQTPDIPANCQWAMFLRNHDELTLEMVTDAERDYLWSTYASDPRARINLGIRRRLAPLMDNDRRKIELMNSILMSMPGTPIIYYGDEIGMGDNIYLGDRNGVRTPMQWTPDRNGGFSRGDPAKLYLPVIMDPVYGYQAVNVEAQSRSISSLLSWTKRLIATRKSSQVFGRGTLSFVRPKNRSVLAYVRQYENEAILCVANLSRSAQAVELDMRAWQGRIPREMLGRTLFPQITENPFVVTLAPYGFFWFLLTEPEEARADASAIQLELATIVLRDGWHDLLHGRERSVFERETLSHYLPARRWFAEKSGWSEAKLAQGLPLGQPAEFLWAIIEVTSSRGEARYSLPLTVKWARLDRAASAPTPEVLSPVRRGAREGTLIDATADRNFIVWLLDRLQSAERVEREGGILEFGPSKAFAAAEKPNVRETRVSSAEQSNTSVIVDGEFVVKFFRRMQPGANPDIEVSRFLTDVAGYSNIPEFIGSVELVQGGERHALAIVQRFVENQGDGWALTSAYLDRFLDESRVLSPDATANAETHAVHLLRMRQLGRRLGELHRALASGVNDPAFAPQAVTPGDLRQWGEQLADASRQAFVRLNQKRGDFSEQAKPLAEMLLARQEEVLSRISTLLPETSSALKIRHHGDFHLGQVLIVKDDVYMVDFEGEPERPMDYRRQKAPAARDLAGLIRSIDYAGISALDRALEGSAEDHARLTQAVDAWRGLCVEATLASYQEAVTDHPLWPADPAEAQRLLDFYVLEKAIYEIGYELANRPAWLHVPLMGATRLLFGENVDDG